MINKLTEELIVSFEGEKLLSYKDTGGVWTIGVGHTSDEHFKVVPNQLISKEQSRKLLAIDLKEAEAFVDKLVKVPLNENQRGALVSFTFNLGGGSLKISTLLKKLNAGNYDAVPSELNKWVYDDGVKLKGLVRRREAEGKLWNTPVIKSTVTEKPVQSDVPVAEKEVPEKAKGSPAGFLAAVVAVLMFALAKWLGIM